MALTFSTTQQMLLGCARVEPGQAWNNRVDRLLREYPVDWRQFLGEAAGHGIFPLICRNLTSSHGHLIPASVLRLLEMRLRLATTRNVALTCELIEIIDLLTAHGIRALPFKGPVLSAALYGSPCMREFADLDVLVDRRDGNRAVSLLAANGYATEPPGSSESRAGSHRTLTSCRTRATLELQWDIGQRWGLHRSGSVEALGFEELWRRRENVHVYCRTLPSPCAEDLVVMLSVHGARHLWSRLVWIADFAALVHTRPGIDWRRAGQLAEEYHCSRRLWVAHCLATQLLGVEEPQEVRREVETRPGIQALAQRVQRLVMDASSTAVNGRTRLALDLDEISLLSSLPDDWMERARVRLRYLITRIPPNALDRRVAKLPRPLSAGYCVIRPIRLIWTYLQP